MQQTIPQDNLGSRKNKKNKFKVDFTHKHAYKAFVDKYGKVVTYKVYKKLCVEMNTFIMNSVILKGFDFFLPCNLGALGIRKKKVTPYIDNNGKLKVNHITVDYKATKELWRKNPEAKKAKKLIRQLNKHTDGYRYNFYWDKTTSNVINQGAYKFYATRKHNRRLNEILSDPDREVDFNMHLKSH